MRRVTTFATTLVTAGLVAGSAYAAVTGGGGALPWDAPLTTVQTDLSGTTAGTLALIAFVVVFGVLVFGGELNFFGRSLCYTIMAAAVLTFGVGLLGALGMAGATVGTQEPVFHFAEFLAGILLTNALWMLGLYLHRRYIRWQASSREAAIKIRDGIAA